MTPQLRGQNGGDDDDGGKMVKYDDSSGKPDPPNGQSKPQHLCGAHHNGLLPEREPMLWDDEVDALPERMAYSNFDLLCTLISLATYVFDLVMDVVIAVYFYHLAVTHGIYHYWYFGLTVTFILLPSLTMTGFSFR